MEEMSPESRGSPGPGGAPSSGSDFVLCFGSKICLSNLADAGRLHRLLSSTATDTGRPRRSQVDPGAAGVWFLGFVSSFWPCSPALFLPLVQIERPWTSRDWKDRKSGRSWFGLATVFPTVLLAAYFNLTADAAPLLAHPVLAVHPARGSSSSSHLLLPGRASVLGPGCHPPPLTPFSRLLMPLAVICLGPGISPPHSENASCQPSLVLRSPAGPQDRVLLSTWDMFWSVSRWPVPGPTHSMCRM